MQIRVAVGMLAALLLVLLAPSITEGLVLTRCQMDQKLNQTVPANISSNLSGNTSDAAHIVCYAELVSGLNTSKVSQPPNAPDNSGEDHRPKHDDSSETSGESKPHKGRKQRSLGSQPGSKPEPKSDKGGSGGKPSKPDGHGVTRPPNPHSEAHTESHNHNATGGNHTGPHDQHPEHNESSEASGESKPHKGRKQRSLGPKPGSKPDNAGRPSKPDDHSVTHPPNPHSEAPKPHPTGAPHHNSSKPTAKPKPHKNPTTAPHHVNQTGPHGHNGAESKPKGRVQRSIKWPKPEPKPQPKPEPKPDKGGKHDESGETFYGVFQLSDRVACVSGNKTTLNLCGLTCDKLIDDDITDDIACLRTLISKFTPVDSLKGEAKEHVKKLYGQLYQKQCASVADAQFFSGC